MTNLSLLTYYNCYNHAYWRDQLPDIPVYFGRLQRERAGTARRRRGGWTIVINRRYRDMDCFVLTTLLHEMAHVRVGYRGNAHGRVFSKERRRLILAGAFDDLL